MLLLNRRAQAYVFLGFCLLLLAGSATIVLAVRSGEADFWVAHTLKVQQAAAELMNAVEEDFLAMRGLLLTNDGCELERATQAGTDTASALSELRGLTADNPEQQAALAELEPALNGAPEYLRNVLTFAQEGRHEAALALVKSGLGAGEMTKLKAEINAFAEREDYLLGEREGQQARRCASGSLPLSFAA